MRLSLHPERLQIARRIIVGVRHPRSVYCTPLGPSFAISTTTRQYSTGASHIPFEAFTRWTSATSAEEKLNDDDGNEAFESMSPEEIADRRRQKATRDGFQSSFRHERWEKQRETQEDWGEGATTRDAGSSGSHTNSNSNNNSSNDASNADPNNGRRASPQERRQISHKWENAFFGRVHFEPGMHDRFQSAMNADDEGKDSHSGPSTSPHSNGSHLGNSQSSSSSSNNKNAPFSWPDDEEAPVEELRRLPDSEVKRYIIQRLVRGERRIRFAPDYGSLVMMQYLNMGEMMINEAEKLLDVFGWMNEDIFHRIEDVKAEAKRIKYDFDLD